MKILRVSDIDGILLFGDYYGKLISELYRNPSTKIYLKYIIKYGEEDVSDFISAYVNVMEIPFNIHDAVENWREYNWAYYKENNDESRHSTAVGRKRGWL